MKNVANITALTAEATHWNVNGVLLSMSAENSKPGGVSDRFNLRQSNFNHEQTLQLPQKYIIS